MDEDKPAYIQLKLPKKSAGSQTHLYQAFSFFVFGHQPAPKS